MHESDRVQERIDQAFETLTLLSQDIQAIAQENAAIRQANQAFASRTYTIASLEDAAGKGG